MTCIELDAPAPLFADFLASARARLADSPLGGLLPGEVVADLFCGAGGWGEGLKLLGGRVGYAINHSPDAIFTHSRNNPDCAHHLGDAWKARPREVIGSARLGLLLASAACTTHSRAKGAAPVSKRIHMLGWCIARWMEEATPRIVLIENVPEWQDWGPTVVNDKGLRVQDPARKGQHFRRWWRYCERLGYVMEKRVLDAPDYGEASRRKRLFIIARRDGQPIVWPEVTHGHEDKGRTHSRTGQPQNDDRPCEQSGATTPCRAVRRPAVVLDGGEVHPTRLRVDPQNHQHTDRPAMRPLRTAADIIDWSDLGRSIFDRKQALKPKTQARIAEGIRRYVIADAAPFVLRVTHGEGSWKVSPIDAPLPTQTTRQDLAVCSPVVAPQNSGVFGQRPDAPGPSITTHGHQSLTVPVLAGAGGSAYAAKPTRADAPLNTVKCDERRAIGTPILAVCAHGDGKDGTKRWGRPALPVDGPINAIHAQGNNFGVATPVCIHAHHGGGQATRADSPTPGITAGGVHANVCVPLTTDYYGNASTAHPANEPLGTATTVDRHGVVGVMLGLGADGAKRALQTAAWLRKYLGDAVPIEAETGLAYTVIGGVRRYFIDILFRMLRALELAAAMGFPADYEWPRSSKGTINQRVAVRMIGNAVSVRTALALIGSVLPRLTPQHRKAVSHG